MCFTCWAVYLNVMLSWTWGAWLLCRWHMTHGVWFLAAVHIGTPKGITRGCVFFLFSCSPIYSHTWVQLWGNLALALGSQLFLQVRLHLGPGYLPCLATQTLNASFRHTLWKAPSASPNIASHIFVPSCLPLRFRDLGATGSTPHQIQSSL